MMDECGNLGGFVALRAARAAQRRAAGHASLSLSSGIGAAWRCGNSSVLVVFGWYLMRGRSIDHWINDEGNITKFLSSFDCWSLGVEEQCHQR